MPNAITAIRIANTKACANNIRTIDSAMQLHYAEHRAWPADFDSLCTGGYLPSEACTGGLFSLQCPIIGTLYSINAAGNRCNHGGHFLAGNYPDIHIVPAGS